MSSSRPVCLLFLEMTGSLPAGFRTGKVVVFMVSQVSVAYQQIKSMIFHMQLLPGTRIPESMICEKLSISRTPIRDALRALASEGLVTIELNRGATVKDFSDDEVRKIGEIRWMFFFPCWMEWGLRIILLGPQSLPQACSSLLPAMT